MLLKYQFTTSQKNRFYHSLLVTCSHADGFINIHLWGFCYHHNTTGVNGILFVVLTAVKNKITFKLAS